MAWDRRITIFHNIRGRTYHGVANNPVWSDEGIRNVDGRNIVGTGLAVVLRVIVVSPHQRLSNSNFSKGSSVHGQNRRKGRSMKYTP
jgi:hypothetical protein